MQKYSFIINLIKRYGSENPSFWAKFKKIGLIGTVLLAAVIGGHKTGLYIIPDTWYELLLGINGIAIGIFGTAAAGTTDPKLMDDKTIQNAKSNTIR